MKKINIFTLSLFLFLWSFNIGNTQGYIEIPSGKQLTTTEPLVLGVQDATPSTPISGFLKFYTKTDNKLYKLNSAGEETEIGAGGSGTGDVESVGDCTGGACYDGSSDGGTYVRLYDGDSHYTSIQAGNSTANLTFLFPNTAIARGSLLIGSSTANALGYLTIGTAGKILTTDGTDPSWSAFTVAAPGAANAILTSDGTNWTRSTTFTGNVTGNLTGNVTGNVSGTSGSTTGNAATVTVADAADDTTTWLLLGTSQTGSLSPATDASATYNASTGALTATSFVGNLTGTASGNVPNSTYDAHTILYATTDNTPVALTVGEQTVVGRVTSGNIAALSIDADLSSVSANDDTIPSAKATKAYADTKQTSDADLTAIAGLTVAQGKIIIGSASPAWSASAYTLPVTACTENQILKANSSGNLVCGADDNSGSATSLTDIGDATADGTIAQAGYKTTWTSSLNSAAAIWTFTNTTADLTADVSFIDFKYTDDGDANGYYLRGYDNSGNDLKWSIGPDGLFTGTFSGNLTGAVTGNASTATALAADPANCAAGQIAIGVNASGVAECTATPSGLTSVGATTFTGALTGNASTATALASDPSDCSAGQVATGIAASGNLSCTATPTLTALSFGADPADAGAIRLSNTDNIAWEASAAGTDVVGMSVDSSEVVQIGPSGASAVTITPSTTITGQLTMTANPRIYDGDSHHLTLDVANLSADATLVLGGDTNTVSLTNGTASMSVGAGKTVNFTGTFTDGRVCTYTATGNVIACNTTVAVPTTITVADTTDTTSYVALFESATGDLGPKTDAGVTYNAGTGILTATGFSGNLTGAVTGNASTATALASNPTDCSANQFANAIAANGNLTCAAIADADVPDALTISGGTINNSVIGGTTAAAGTFTTLNAGGTGFSVDADGDTSAKSFTVTKSSGVAGDLGLYEANSTDTHAAGFRGPASITGDGAYRILFPNARASAANSVLAVTNSGETGTGTAADPYIQTGSWVVPIVEGTATGGIVLGDASPDADGEVGYASNAYAFYANSEDFKVTATTNLWTFSSATSATFAFTPQVTFAANPRIYDGDSHYLTLDVSDLSADATLVLGGNTNTVSLTNGTASMSVGAGKTVNFTGTFTDGKLCNFTASGSVIGCNADATGGTPTAITVADTTDTTSYVALFESATGDLGPKTDAGITYNAGTGILTSTGMVTGATSGIQVGATGVAITSDDDGAITFTGASAGYDESLTINLDDTENTAVISSGSGLTKIDFSAINLVTTGTISGLIPTVVENTSTTYNVTQAQARAGTFFVNTNAATKTWVLPAAEAGMAVCIKQGQGIANIMRVDTDGTDYIVMSTGVRTSAAGDYYGATASATNQICLVAFDATDWYVTSERGTWTEE